MEEKATSGEISKHRPRPVAEGPDEKTRLLPGLPNRGSPETLGFKDRPAAETASFKISCPKRRSLIQLDKNAKILGNMLQPESTFSLFLPLVSRLSWRPEIEQL